MFPLENMYGPKAFRKFHEDPNLYSSLKNQRQNSEEIICDNAIIAKSYHELIDIASFFSVMNKRSNLYYRGQREDFAAVPAIFRPSWRSPAGIIYDIPSHPEIIQQIYDSLNDFISPLVWSVCKRFPMPRRASLEMFREAVWAVVQHYELWPTPLIDVTPNLRVAASFALQENATRGFVYIYALPTSTNSITFDADQHIVLARLQAVCPPVAKRPHYQDGYLVGRFPFISPVSNVVDKSPVKVSNVSRRLVAKVELIDLAAMNEGSNDAAFWSESFPMMRPGALLPDASQDRMLLAFGEIVKDIDERFSRIVS